jgi:hypothetical protein
MSASPSGVLPLISGQDVSQELYTLHVLGGQGGFSQITRDP